MRETIQFEVTPKDGPSFVVSKTISRRSIYRVIVNLIRKHKALDVGILQ